MSLTQVKKAGLDSLALDHVFTIGASGTDHYTFQGEGLNGTVNDPTLYLTRGKTYRFENGTGAHAIRIQSADDGTSGTLYNTGVTNNNTTGTVIVEVQHDAPDVLYYQCASHANMKGILYITGALADGGVTSAKIADGAIINANVNTSAAIAGTKIAPNFGSQNIVTTGEFNSASVTITGGTPAITFTDSNNDPDYLLQNNNGALRIYDSTNSAERFVVNTDGHIDIAGNLDANGGLDVTGNITVSGTVDGIDIATDVAANTAKTTNATHTGDVTGSTSLTIANDAVTTAKIADNAVNMNKLSDLDNGRIIARVSSGAGNPEAATAAQIRTLLNVEDGSTAGGGQANNLIINGSMAVSQRNTTFSPSGTDQFYTLDRFEHVTTSGADGNCTITQNQSYNISGVGDMKSYKITPDATNTPTGGGNVTIRHIIEGQDLQHLEYGTSNAKSITISFYAKTAAANSGDQYTLCLFHNRSSDGAQRTINASFTPTSSWQRFTLTFAGDTDTSYDMQDGNGVGMTLTWILASGPDDIMSQKSSWATDGGYFRAVTGQSNFMDSTSNEFFMTGVQMEVGTSASDFVQESFAETLSKCQRYYDKSYHYSTVPGTATQTGAVVHCLAGTYNYAGFPLEFSRAMRDTPTITVYSTNNGTAGKSSADSSDANASVGYVGDKRGFQFRANSSSGTAANVFLRVHYQADAEL